MLIDADALYALSLNEYTKLNLKDKVLTPHHKEFADLIGISVQELEMSLLEQGSNFAKNTGCILILKGAPTIVFDNEGNFLRQIDYSSLYNALTWTRCD